MAKNKNVQKKLDIIGFIVLTFFLSLFIFFALHEKRFDIPVLTGFILTSVLLVIGYVHVGEKPKHKRYGVLEHCEVVVGCMVGAVVTYFISVELGAGPVIGAAIVGVVVAFAAKNSDILKDMPAPVYCGAFVGMVAPFVLPSIILVALAGIIAGFVFALSHEVYTGIGGKLGTIAFIGVALAVFTLKMVGML